MEHITMTVAKAAVLTAAGGGIGAAAARLPVEPARARPVLSLDARQIISPIDSCQTTAFIFYQ